MGVNIYITMAQGECRVCERGLRKQSKHYTHVMIKQRKKILTSKSVITKSVRERYST